MTVFCRRGITQLKAEWLLIYDLSQLEVPRE